MTSTLNRTTKGAVAAGVAAALLLGGAGTLAFWDASTDVTGTPITSGELKLGIPACGDWTLDGGTALGSQLIVPGDVLTKRCTIDLIATGAHIGADLGIDTAAFSATNGLTDELDPAAVFTVGGVTKTHITETDDTGATPEIVATITVTFDGPAATNGSQDLTATLNTIAVTATQTHDG